MKLFRGIRRATLLADRLGKYFLYAVGEIVLVVIGILIALQINDANEDRKRATLEVQYLNNLKDDLIADSLYYTRTWFDNGPKKIAGLQKAREYYLTRVTPVDTIAFINDAAFGGIYGIGGLTPNNRTYEELLSTGSISLISNGMLRNRISDYYREQDFLKSYTINLQSGYSKYMNAVKSFDPAHPTRVDDGAVPTILATMLREEFYFLVNQELTFAYSFLDRLRRSRREANLLSREIEYYLSTGGLKRSNP